MRVDDADADRRAFLRSTDAFDTYRRAVIRALELLVDFDRTSVVRSLVDRRRGFHATRPAWSAPDDGTFAFVKQSLFEKRGVTAEEARALGYRSFPVGADAHHVIEKLQELHGDKLLSVPGFDRADRFTTLTDGSSVPLKEFAALRLVRPSSSPAGS